MPEPRSASLAVRLKPDIRAAVEQAARDDNRTLSSFTETVLAGWLVGRNYLKPCSADRPEQVQTDQA